MLPALLVAAAVAPGGAAADSPCPEQLFGIWSADLPAAELFDFRVSLEEPSPDDWKARIRTGGGGEEIVPVRRSGGRLRFQPTVASVAFQTYRVGDREIESIEARGNGGQYIFVVPEFELVAVITSGNYRNRDLLHQPEEILQRFILPAAVN